jgi:hypothetical protein
MAKKKANLRSPKGTNLRKLADAPGRGKDKSPRKIGVLKVPKTVTGVAAGMEMAYWMERVGQLRGMLADHMKANYKKARKDQKFTPQGLAKIGCDYLESEIMFGRPLTISGLAYALGTDSEHLLRLRKLESKEPDKIAFKDIASRLKNFIEMYVEQQLHLRQNPTGCIFTLKNFGWQDKTEVDHTVFAGLTREEKEETKLRMRNFAE